MPLALAPFGFLSSDINYRAESVTLPKLDPTTVEIVIRGNKILRPGIGDFGGNTITLTCVETVDNKIAAFVKAWRELHWSLDDSGFGITHYPQFIEADIIIARLDNTDQPIWFYHLFGCKLQTIDPGTLDAAGADPLKPALNIAYDRFIEWGFPGIPK